MLNPRFLLQNRRVKFVVFVDGSPDRLNAVFIVADVTTGPTIDETSR